METIRAVSVTASLMPRAAVGARQVTDVGHGTAPVGAALEPVEAATDTEQAAEVAGVAVGVPTGGVDDLEGLSEVAAAVQECVDDEAVVRDHVAVAAVTVVAVFALDGGERLAPRAVFRVPLADIADHAVEHTVLRYLGDAGVDQRIDVVLDEGERLHGRQHLGSVDRLAVVRDAPGAAREVGGALGVSRRHHRPPVDEDLRADLFGDHLAVRGHRTAAGRLDAFLQPQVGRVLGRVAETAPPQHGAVLDEVVEPGLPDLRRGQVGVAAVILERPQERERAADVVVGDDERYADLVVHVVVDLAELVFDATVGPALERAPEIDPHDLSEHARVDALLIVLR